ncbi:uncharacterized protein LOC133904758 [Phragmites australis]|uniref:uncharacterized protein LOC133904758 n=1 Tax=Phragmites australis TaxID=29695 RepID=UPI002D78C6EB|nr:uncharacterized protein LOC133904758 [Phragmites australis]
MAALRQPHLGRLERGPSERKYLSEKIFTVIRPFRHIPALRPEETGCGVYSRDLVIGHGAWSESLIAWSLASRVVADWSRGVTTVPDKHGIQHLLIFYRCESTCGGTPLFFTPTDTLVNTGRAEHGKNSAGIENPTVEVRFENLSIDAEAYVGKRGIPTAANFFMNKTEEALNLFCIIPTNKAKISVLHEISGIIKPSRLTLLLGPPGSGRTSLLLAFVGQLDSALKMSGIVTLNDRSRDTVILCSMPR